MWQETRVLQGLALRNWEDWKKHEINALLTWGIFRYSGPGRNFAFELGFAEIYVFFQRSSFGLLLTLVIFNQLWQVSVDFSCYSLQIMVVGSQKWAGLRFLDFRVCAVSSSVSILFRKSLAIHEVYADPQCFPNSRKLRTSHRCLLTSFDFSVLDFSCFPSG